MSSGYPLAPLTANGPLRIAITGRHRAGKTTLLTHFLSHAHETIIQPRQPLPPPRPQHPILARLAASRLATILGRTVHLALSFVRLLRRDPPSYARHDLLPQPNAQPITFLDARGEAGLHSLYAEAAHVDVILFVTRLDHSRADRQDKNLLSEIVDVFGNEVLDRLIIVLTRGCALPPLNLSFKEFVRGRSDLLASYVRLVWPPVVVPTAEATGEKAPLVSGGAIKNTAASPDDDDMGDITLIGSHHRGFRFRRRLSQDSAEEPLTPAVKSVVAALVNDDDTDEGSVSAIPEDFLDPLFEAGVHPDDKRVFKDPMTPPIAVVELSESCRTNDAGERILPDGTPWFSHLVATIAEVSQDAPRKAAERIARKEEEMRPPPMKFSSHFREMVHSLSRDAFRIVLVQVALVVLVWQIGSAVQHGKERKEKIAEKEESDVLLELSDEEFDVLTRPDPGSGGNAVLRFDKGEDDELDLEESEEEFFGRADKKRRREREESSQEIPIPIPQVQIPFSEDSIPELDEKTIEEPSAAASDEKKTADGAKKGKETETDKDQEAKGQEDKDGESTKQEQPSKSTPIARKA